MFTFSSFLALTACFLTTEPAPPVTGFEVEPVVIKVSKETTFLDGPLHKDGTVDYVTALDRMNAKGVTKENNAVPLLWQALGTQIFYDQSLRETQAKMLGVEPPSPKAYCLTHLVDLMKIANASLVDGEVQSDQPSHWQATVALLTKEDMATLKRTPEQLLEERDDLYAQVDKATQTPWTAKNQPLLAIWIKVNAEPIRLIEAASKRTRYYWPHVGGPESDMIEMALPAIGFVRDCGRILCCRAMLRLEAGDMSGAWQDYLTINRLARLVAQSPNLIAQLVGISLDAMTEPILLRLLDSGKLSVDQIKAMAVQFDELGHSSDFERAINLTERCLMLDMIGMIRRRGFSLVSQMLDDDGHFNESRAIRNINAIDMVMDSNLALKTLNGWADALVEVCQKPTCMQRLEALQTLKERMQTLVRTRSQSLIAVAAWTLVLPAEQRRKVASEKIADRLAADLVPAHINVIGMAEQARMRRELSRVAFALAMYQAEHKSYPKTLAELSPRYIAKVPVDRFDEKPLRYQPTDNGYLLYSIGINMKDEGGKETGEDGIADLVVRMPQQKSE